MKERLITLLVSLMAGLPLLAVPAYPGKILYTQPDGSKIEIRLHGDEFGSWATDSQGNILSQDDKGFWRVDFGADVQTIGRRAAARREAMNIGRRWNGIPAFGQKHFLVVLADFPDVPFTIEDTQAAFSRMMNEPGYSEDGAYGSARDYFYENSHGRFEPVFDVYGPVTLPRELAYYGAHSGSAKDQHPADALADACELLDGEIDFSQYDADGDGQVDMVFMFFAGHSEADTGIADCLWPHMSYLSGWGIDLVLDGISLNKYACASELAYTGKLSGIGTPCHEFSHTLGVPDMYDTDYAEYGYAAGMYYFSLMSGGNYLGNGWLPPYYTMEERLILKWVDKSAFEEITAPGDYVLESVREDKAYKTSTDLDGEYFVYECRNNSGWDAGLYAHGMVVYHVDKSYENLVRTPYGGVWDEVSAYYLWVWEGINILNHDGEHPCCNVVGAPDPENVRYGFDDKGNYINDGEYLFYLPFPGYKGVTSYTARSWHGIESEMNLQDIKYTGDNVTFTVKYVPHVPVLDFFSIKAPGHGKYATGSSFALEVNTPEGQSYDGVQWYFDGVSVSGNAVALNAAGTHLVEAEVALPDGGRQKASVEIEVK